jgi:hypothetical protein
VVLVGNRLASGAPRETAGPSSSSRRTSTTATTSSSSEGCPTLPRAARTRRSIGSVRVQRRRLSSFGTISSPSTSCGVSSSKSCSMPISSKTNVSRSDWPLSSPRVPGQAACTPLGWRFRGNGSSAGGAFGDTGGESVALHTTTRSTWPSTQAGSSRCSTGCSSVAPAWPTTSKRREAAPSPGTRQVASAHESCLTICTPVLDHRRPEGSWRGAPGAGRSRL